LLNVTDAAGDFFPNSVSVGVGAGGNQVALNVVAGQTYFVEVGNPWAQYFGSSTGGYQLTFTPYSPTGGDTPATAHPLTLAADGTGSQGGNLAVAGAVHYYRLVSPLTGPLQVQAQSAFGGALSPSVTVYDSTGTIWIGTYSDSGATFLAQRDHTYYIEVSGDSSTGYYLLTVAPATAAGATAAGQPIAVPSSNIYQGTGAIQTPGEEDLYSFVAHASGPVTVTLDAPESTLETSLSVWDFSDNSFDSVAAGTRGSQTALYLVAGQMYFIQASGLYDTTGTYRIRIAPYPNGDDFGNLTSQAHPVNLDASGSWTQEGTIEVVGDVDVFSFVEPRTGVMNVRQQADSGNTLTSYLTQLSSDGGVSAFGLNTGSGTSDLTFPVTAGQTYYVQASGGQPLTTGTVGDYTLTFSTLVDGVGHTQETATLLTLSDTGAASQAGRIAAAGQTNDYKFVAPVTGSVIIDLSPSAGSSLNCAITASPFTGYNSSFGISLGAGESQVALPVVAGQIYIIQAGAADGSTGNYRLTLTPYQSDYGSTFETATAVSKVLP
jgi:hypothetical protein